MENSLLMQRDGGIATLLNVGQDVAERGRVRHLRPVQLQLVFKLHVAPP